MPSKNFLAVTALLVVSMLPGCREEALPRYLQDDYSTFERDPLSAPQNYFILEQRNGEPVLVTKCGGYSQIVIDGRTFKRAISYQLSGARWYNIVKKDISKSQKTILCQGSLISPGYIDTNVRVKITYKDIDFRTKKFIIDTRGEDGDKKDTLYATTMPFLSGYKIEPYGCSLKAQPLDSLKIVVNGWGIYTVD